MKKILIYAMGCLLLMGMSSCKDFLEKYPYDSIPEDDTFNTADEFREHWFGVYSSLKGAGGFTEACRVYGDIQCDLFQSVQSNQGLLSSVYNWNFNASDPNTNSIYGAMWMTIGRVNRILDNYPKIKANATDEDIEWMETYLGDLYFIRAYCYSELVKYYCEAYDPARAGEQLGMSIVKTLDHERNLPRASLKDTYDFMLEDLEEAGKRIVRAVDLNTVAYEQNCVASTQAVLALKARLYLYMQDYPKASETALKCWDACLAGQLFLANTAEYYDLLLEDGITTEVIMRLAMTPVDVQGSIGSYFCMESAGKVRPEYIPSVAFLDMFEANDIRSNMFTRTRLGYQHGLEWEICTKSGHSTELDKSSYNPAYQSMPALFRMSELALIIAEANAANPNGDMSLANDYMNQLKKARIEKWDSKKYNAVDMLRVVKDERAKELCLEGFRLADLKRWHMGILRKPQPYTNAPFNALEIKADDPRFTWPIPQHEMDVNDKMEGNASN
ncbi:RagB/SusD family nutrient uptake outer membrane protein [Butyricimonas sp. Marseille-P3923]|uniref:RagB/SusD family nutrient uptake outer membrane protein n=1 Tax=Butyricimonas sp. Marseille-P3923 TaxID=1987504 RepID=UPI000C078E0D|nr:RagB/SusD family nutrient uptake outer membrane protein [Butyricimonas sp. Marseille-P3923]